MINTRSLLTICWAHNFMFRVQFSSAFSLFASRCDQKKRREKRPFGSESKCFTQFPSRELQLDCRQEIPALLCIFRDDDHTFSFMLNIDASETCNGFGSLFVVADFLPFLPRPTLICSLINRFSRFGRKLATQNIVSAMTHMHSRSAQSLIVKHISDDIRSETLCKQ